LASPFFVGDPVVGSMSRPRRTESRNGPGGLSLGKKTLFALVCFGAVLALQETILRLAGVPPAYVAEDPYVGFTSQVTHFVTARGASGVGPPAVTLAPGKSASLNPVEFPAKKLAGTYRIVAVGGSTTYGRPFFDDTSFAGWLRRLLTAIEPRREWEVINAGAISYASYRVARVMQELCAYEPDMFVVYCGHNEFLERRTYQDVLATPRIVREAAALVSRTRTATAVRGIMDTLGFHQGIHAQKPNMMADKVRAIPVRIVGPSDYRRDDRLREQVTEHFAWNLRRMIQIARSAGATVLIIVPASNLKDFSPIRSDHRPGMQADELRQWEAAYNRGLTELRTGQSREAAEAFGRALALDDRYATLHFHLATVYQRMGKADLAGFHFRRARDEDICPLRAIQPIVDAVRRVARETDVPVVDFEQILARATASGIAGYESFHDHVHPRVDANRQLAVGIVEQFSRLGIVRIPPDFHQNVLPAVDRAVRTSIDGPRHAGELARLAEMLDWMGKRELALRTTLEALELADSGRLSAETRRAHTSAVHQELGRFLSREGRDEEAKQHFDEAARLQSTPRSNSGP
jgi:tetratricopeptide (TPR) repeat protein